MSDNAPRFISRRADYLGIISTTLRNLAGYTTLANELIQNADDAEATRIDFDITVDGLIVDNDAQFSDCGSVSADECPWRDGERGHRCDFHSFRVFGGGDKRRRAHTIGAFGIGFTAVYQITDAPHVISGDHHWILHEGALEHERIERCDGCELHGKAGTRFWLPFARDPESRLRRDLAAPAVAEDIGDGLLTEFGPAIAPSLLFLSHVRAITVRRDGREVKSARREDLGPERVVLDGLLETRWVILEASFEETARELRGLHGEDRIDTSRSDRVEIAIAASPMATGRLYLGLPTQHDTGLPLQINADFFPAIDRKKVIFEHQGEWQSAWNRAAVEAAAQRLAVALNELGPLLGPGRLWDLIKACSDVAVEASIGRREASFGEFWRHISTALPKSRVAYAFDGAWHLPGEVLLLESEEEVASQALLDELGLPTVHPEIRGVVFRLPENAGVPRLALGDLLEALDRCHLVEPEAPRTWPAPLNDPDTRVLLWRAVQAVCDPKRGMTQHLLNELSRTALVDDMARRPRMPDELYRTSDSATDALFSQVGVEFVAPDALRESAPAIYALCRPFRVPDAVAVLQRVDPRELASAIDGGAPSFDSLIRWFEQHRDELDDDEDAAERLAELQIYRSGNGARCRLNELVAPGDFIDPLALTGFIDPPETEGHLDILHALGLRDLTFVHYASEHLPRAFAEHHERLDPAGRRSVLKLVATHIGDVLAEPGLRIAVADLPLAETADGWHKPADTYFASDEVARVLGDSAKVVSVPEENRSAVEEALAVLGAAYRPRHDDVLDRARSISALRVSPSSVRDIQEVLRYVGGLDPNDWRLYAGLQTARWLPAVDVRDRWHAPAEVHSVFRKHLFESQARFVDLPSVEQGRFAGFLEFLGVPYEPSAKQVVDHLLQLVARGLPANPEIYTFLDQNVEAPPVNRLKGTACLWDGERYLRPEEVFWSGHPFGRYRYTARDDLRKISGLLTHLGVRDQPEASDAIAVLDELHVEFGSRYLDEDVQAVVHACWSLLDTSLQTNSDTKDVVAALSDRLCALDARGIFSRPKWLFFEDRPGLKDKFGPELRDNVIMRPPNAWHALQVAGVTNLGEAVSVRLVECGNRTIAEQVNTRLQGRVAGLRRVAAEIGEHLDEARVTSLTCEAADPLEVQYSLVAFGSLRLSSDIEVPDAIYERDSGVIFISARGAPRWAAVAREVALATFPNREPGAAASGIFPLLSAATDAEALAVLDELGFPRLAGSHDIVLQSAELTAIGTELDGDAAEQAQWVPPDWEATPVAMAGEAGQTARRAGGIPSIAEAPDDGRRPSEEHGQAANSERRPRAKLRTYVVDGDGRGVVDGSSDGQRSEVDQAGIVRVVEQEEREGRVPEVQAHHNAGYDIVAREGNDIRYIEVKSLSGAWDAMGVGLSRPQFEMGMELGGAYWLYVVEFATSDRARVWRIQDPSRRANQFFFDDGWQAVAGEAVSVVGQDSR